MRALGKGSIAEIIRVGLLIAWVLLWVAAAGLAVAAIGYPIVLALIHAGIIDPQTLATDGANIQIRSGGSIDVAYAGGATWPVVVPALLIGAVAIGGGLMIVWRLRKLFDSFCAGDPFAKENAIHLRAIWMTMLAIEIARYVLLALTGLLIATFGRPSVQHAELKLHVDLSTWASILILIVLAEVFREGARLRREQELTI